ncbi:MAG TPA: hypothetical protein VIH59_16130 [Candidatus Tectomicrobia bacterium]
MPLHDWLHRYPGVKHFLEQPEDVLEGVSTEPPPRHVYTLKVCAGETIHAGEKVRFDGEYAVLCSPGQRPVGIALTDAETGESIRIQISEAYFAH